MTAQSSIPLAVTPFDIKEISMRLQKRAGEVNVHLPLSASLELAASVFGYHNYHEVAPVIKGIASIDIVGVKVSSQMIDAVFSAYEKATGSKSVALVVNASDPGGEFTYAVFQLNSKAFQWMLEELLVGSSREHECDVRNIYPSYAWRSEFYAELDGSKLSSSYFYSTATHKHSDGEVATSRTVGVHRAFIDILFALAESFAPELVAGLNKTEKEEGLISTGQRIQFAGDNAEMIDELIDSGDFIDMGKDPQVLHYGDGHLFPVHTIFVQE